MKVQIPESLKADLPQNIWGKILSATPVVMAVVATMLAGLSSSEMTRAQYARALAAQRQSKAGDQWSFFQAKRLRSAIQRNTADLLQTITELRPLEVATLRNAAEQLLVEVRQANGSDAQRSEAEKIKTEMLAVLDSSDGQQALSFLQRGEIPRVGAAPSLDPRIKAALDGMEDMRPDSEMTVLLAPVSEKMLDAALLAARDQAQAFELDTKPVNQAVDRLDNLLARMTVCLQKPAAINRDFTVARLRYQALRYEVEARLNQAIANLYELQVRKSNITAQRHHARSQRFFFGMLGAQLGVIISTVAMAARQRNILWSLAAVAGLLAIAFAIYVYLFV